MYMSKASHLAVPKHQRPPIWTEEAAGFHKRVKRIHDPVKTVVPCAVFEAESPIPPDRSIQFSSHIEKKLDDDPHTSRGDLETSKASIGRHQHDEIDRQPPPIIDLHPPDIDRLRQPLIDRHHPPNIDRFPLLDVPPGCIIEMEPIEERLYMSKASHLAVPKHQRPPIWTEEAARFHKRVKRIHDPMKIVVPCAVFEAKSPIPPDRIDKGPTEAASIDTDRIPSNDTNKPASIDTITSTSINTGRISEQKEFNVCENLRDGDTTTRSDKSGGKKRRNWKKRKRTNGGSQFSLIPRYSDGVRKPRVRSRCFSHPFAKLRALLLDVMPVLLKSGQSAWQEEAVEEMKDCRGDEGLSIDNTALVSIDIDASIWAEHIL
ncbi:hypothetical protein DY000_02007993 [Brassica cretica]|uniref:Uncharacterized protein n=1 Tax=Brassica cretica TaxID=69181 RepID=A0ABQ7C591_BRACR|nr:hypothetical protein DY000_02007993 [Brassica cretica]